MFNKSFDQKYPIWTDLFKILRRVFEVLRLTPKFKSARLSFLIYSLVLLSCTSHPKKSETTDQAEFGLQGKALLAHIEQADQVLNLEIIVKPPSSARVEFFNTGLGVYLGRLIISQNKFLLVYSREQKYFAGDNAPSALMKWFLVPLSVEDFVGLLSNKPPKSRDWICNEARLTRCSLKDEPAVKIEFNSENNSRQIKITSNEGQINMKLSPMLGRLDSTKDRFSLSPPVGFEKGTL